MQQLTDQGWQKILDLSRRYGVSTDAVLTLLQALINGNGTMAQFYHNELGGGGQWMQGGMTMVGDMFNNSLKSRVDGLCSELSVLLSQQPFLPAPVSTQSQYQGGGQQQQQGYGGQGGQQQQGGYGSAVSLFVPGPAGGSGSWWPSDLGMPNSSGGQNNIRYAYFANSRRLAVEINGHVTVYDTQDHQIGGVSQQQGGSASLTFTSQYGTVRVADLPIISIDGVLQTPASQSSPAPAQQGMGQPTTAQEVDIFAKIERLAELKQKGILSQEEFAAKKAELLSRL